MSYLNLPHPHMKAHNYNHSNYAFDQISVANAKIIFPCSHEVKATFCVNLPR